MVGHGKVAERHRRALEVQRWTRVTAILGRDRARATAFAQLFGARGFDDIDAFADGLDAAIVASPSEDHLGHAAALAERGVAVLVEIPIAPDTAGFDRLQVKAVGRGRILATHTARYLPATRLVADVLAAGRLGPLREIAIDRRVATRARPWRDDPLLHHGQHAIDVLTSWFGDIDVRSAVARSDGMSICFVAQVEGGAAVSVAVTHGADRDAMRVTLTGRDRGLVTDGFGRVETDLELPGWSNTEPDAAYAAAIDTQDAAFVGALTGDGDYPDLSIARRNLEIVERVRALAAAR